MIDKEIEAGIERACECGCAPPSTGWTVNPFPIIRDYIERLKHRADVADRIAKKACDIVFSQEIDGEDWECAVSAYKELNDIGSEYGDDVITEDMLYRYLQEQAEREIEEEKND